MLLMSAASVLRTYWVKQLMGKSLQGQKTKSIEVIWLVKKKHYMCKNGPKRLHKCYVCHVRLSGSAHIDNMTAM